MAVLSLLRLHDFGCFPHAELELSPLSVLVGPNDSGKTTLLNAILAYARFADAEARYSGDVGRALAMPALIWHRAKEQQCTIAIAGRVPGAFALEAAIVREGDRSVLSEQEMMVVRDMPRGEREETWRWTKHDERYQRMQPPADTHPADMTIWQQHNGTPSSWEIKSAVGDNPWCWDFDQVYARFPESMPPWLPVFAQVRTQLSSIRLMRFSPAALRTPSAPAATASVPQLEANGVGLPTLLSVLAGAEPERFRAIQRELTQAVPTLAGFKVLPTPQGGHRLVFTLAGSNAPLEASQVSDGALLFLAYASLVHHPEPPAVLLIEEPENGVHPSRLRDIARLLRRLTEPGEHRPATQIIMTTHSPYLLDEHIEPHEAFFCHRDDSGAATVTRFDAIPDLADRLTDYSLGELWTAYGEKDLYERATRARGDRP